MVTLKDRDTLKFPNIPMPCSFWLHVWIDTFGRDIMKGWSIYQCSQSLEFTVTRREWKTHFQQSKDSDQPNIRYSIEEMILSCDQALLSNLINEGKNIKVPLIGVRNSRGKDGSMYGIVLEAPLSDHINFQWWSNGPLEWQQLVRWHRNLREFLDNAEPEK